MLKKICIRAISLMMCLVMIVVSVSAANTSFGDINGDGEITAGDARILLRISAGLDSIDNYIRDEEPQEPSYDETSYEYILSKYTEVMNQLKSDVALYDKKSYQTLSDDYEIGTVGNLMLPIAYGLMTSESKAEVQRRDDAAQIPVIRNTKGCLLTDVSKIKSAEISHKNGKTTIVIVLKDEKNPLPAEDGASTCKSAIGSMFTPLSASELDNIAYSFSAVMTINKYELTGKDCTATLVFDTATGKVESLEQTMNYFVEIDAKAVFVPVSGYATVTNNLVINNIFYKDEDIDVDVSSEKIETKEQAVEYYKKAHSRVLSEAQSVTRTYDSITNYNSYIDVGGNSMFAGLASTLMGTYMRTDDSQLTYKGAAIAANFPPSENGAGGLTADMIGAYSVKEDGDNYIITLSIDSTERNPDSGEKSAHLVSVIQDQQVADATGSFFSYSALRNEYIAPTVTATINKITGQMKELHTVCPLYMKFENLTVAMVISVANAGIGVNCEQNWTVQW